MKNVLQIELNKAIKTRYFAISIIIGTIIGIVGLVYNVNLVYNSQIYDGINPCYEGFTLFNHILFCVSAAYRIAVWLVILRRKK